MNYSQSLYITWYLNDLNYESDEFEDEIRRGIFGNVADIQGVLLWSLFTFSRTLKAEYCEENTFMDWDISPHSAHNDTNAE